jgi:DNA-directed RNA polymerase specialized sigma24 family protein
MGTNRATYQTDLQTLSLAGVAHRCARETELFFQRQSHDPRYGFELFRRAIVDRNQSAWELVYSQYRPLVAGWVKDHAAYPSSGEEAQYFVNRAFERMWAALTPDKFAQFPDLKSVLCYLKMCVHSVILDQVRAADLAIIASQDGVASLEGKANGMTVEDRALARVGQQEFWGEIDARLRSEKERLVVYGSFVLALKPREIYAQHRETFRDVKEVYRVKENVLARLGRDDELRRLLFGDAGKTGASLV